MGDESWANRTIFVTGATGLVGSWLVMGLLERGARVIALVRDHVPESALTSSPAWARIVRVSGELTDLRAIERILHEYEVECCFHLAAQTIVGNSNASPLATFEANIRGTWTMLEAARLYGKLRAFVLASSDKAYGDQRAPYREETPLTGRYPYDVSKSCADLIATSYAMSFGLPVGITRCGNIYGGGDLNYSRVIPGSVKMILEGKNPIIRSDGSHLRAYLYVADAVAGYLALANGLYGGKYRGEAFNFAHGEPITVLELVKLIINVSGRPSLVPDVRGTAKAALEIESQGLNCDKARAALEWAPHVELREGLLSTFDWYKNHLSSSPSQ
jgi:CDP-glucose 4,6-dehydratase